MTPTLFARVAGAAHPDVLGAIHGPATYEAIRMLDAMEPMDAKASRAVARVVLASGSERLVAHALATLPGKIVGDRALPKSAYSDGPADAVAGTWDGTQPCLEAARLWLWVNCIEAENGFVALQRTNAGGEHEAPTPQLMMALSVALMDTLDWSLETNTSSLIALLRWRMDPPAPAVCAVLGPLDRRLAEIPADHWTSAWLRDPWAVSLPTLIGFAGETAVALKPGQFMGKSARDGLVTTLPVGGHERLAMFKALPSQADYERMDEKARVLSLRPALGDPRLIRAIDARKEQMHGPEAELKRTARARKKALRDLERHEQANA